MTDSSAHAVGVSNLNADTFTAAVTHVAGTALTTSLTLYWIAIG